METFEDYLIRTRMADLLAIIVLIVPAFKPIVALLLQPNSTTVDILRPCIFGTVGIVILSSFFFIGCIMYTTHIKRNSRTPTFEVKGS